MRFGHPGTPLDKRRQSLDNRRATAFALLSLINIVPVTLRHSSNFILIFTGFRGLDVLVYRFSGS